MGEEGENVCNKTNKKCQRGRVAAVVLFMVSTNATIEVFVIMFYGTKWND